MIDEFNQPSSAVRAAVQYVVAADCGLYSHEGASADGSPGTNAAFVPREVAILDARRRQSPLSLEAEGAALIVHKSATRDFFGDEQALRRGYFREAAEVIRAASSAEDVVVFDHNVRLGVNVARSDTYKADRPVFHVHTDFTAESARRRAEAVMGRPIPRDVRFAMINLWRPIAEPLRDCPLAICDARSVADEDLVPVDLLYPDRRGEIFYSTYNPAHRWFYAPDMGSDEAWLLKNYDSGDGVAARFTPHTAFVDPTAHSQVIPRASIEVRAVALY